MSFLRERTREICLYMGLVGIFIVMLFLYNVPLDAVQYIVLLMILWGVFCGAIGFSRYRRRHEALLKVERKIIMECGYIRSRHRLRQCMSYCNPMKMEM